MTTRVSNILSSLAAILVAVIALVMSSCSADDEVLSGSTSETDNIVRIGAVVDDIATRAGFTTDNITEFGLYIKNSSNANYSYDNVKVTKQADGSWLPERQMEWEDRGKAVDIIAYAPYKADMGALFDSERYSIAVNADQSGETENSDFVTFMQKGFVPKNDLVRGRLQINLQHMLCRVNIIVSFGPSFGNLTSNPIQSMSFGSVYMGGNWNIQGNYVDTDYGANTSDLIPKLVSFKPSGNDNATATYTCFTIPGSYGVNELKVGFMAEGKRYSWSSNSRAYFSRGGSYTININLE